MNDAVIFQEFFLILHSCRIDSDKKDASSLRLDFSAEVSLLNGWLGLWYLSCSLLKLFSYKEKVWYYPKTNIEENISKHRFMYCFLLCFYICQIRPWLTALYWKPLNKKHSVVQVLSRVAEVVRRTKILSPYMRYFVAILIFVAIYAHFGRL